MLIFKIQLIDTRRKICSERRLTRVFTLARHQPEEQFLPLDNIQPLVYSVL